jgi:hypothetical protein
LSSFDQCKQINLGASESPTPVITGGEVHPVKHFDLVKPMWLLTQPDPTCQ